MASQLEKDFETPYQTWKADPSPPNATQLLRSVQPVVDYGLQLYGRGSAKSPLLRSRAKQLTLSALQSYNPETAKLKTHLLSQLQGLQRIATKQQQVIALPERVSLELQQLHRAGQELGEQLGREPADAELADFTGISRQRMQYLRRAQYPLSEGQVAARISPAADTLPATRSLVDNPDPWHELVYGDLDAKDQFIMERALGMHGHQRTPLTEISRQLRITPGAVSQRVQKIVQKINRREEFSLF